MNTHLKVFVSCVIGAAIGSLVALEAQPTFWWVGLVVGGLVGYLSYDIREVLRAVPVAWHYAIKQPMESWKNVGMSLAGYALILTWVIPSVVLWWTLVPIIPWSEVSAGVIVLRILAVTFSFIAFFAVILGGFKIFLELKIGKEGLEAGLELNPVFVAYAFVSIAVLNKFFLPHLWSAVRTVFRFFQHLLWLIHSDLRLLCGFGAAIGASIGYASGSVLVGVLAGGVIGLVQYDLVSRRWLKIVPNSAS